VFVELVVAPNKHKLNNTELVKGSVEMV